MLTRLEVLVYGAPRYSIGVVGTVLDPEGRFTLHLMLADSVNCPGGLRLPAYCPEILEVWLTSMTALVGSAGSAGKDNSLVDAIGRRYPMQSHAFQRYPIVPMLTAFRP